MSHVDKATTMIRRCRHGTGHYSTDRTLFPHPLPKRLSPPVQRRFVPPFGWVFLALALTACQHPATNEPPPPPIDTDAPFIPTDAATGTGSQQPQIDTHDQSASPDPAMRRPRPDPGQPDDRTKSEQWPEEAWPEENRYSDRTKSEEWPREKWPKEKWPEEQWPKEKGQDAAPAAQPRRAAILLPLSGSKSHLGRALFNAAQMALFDANDDHFILVPFDTRSTVAGASKAAAAAGQSHASVVLGPVYADAVAAAADNTDRVLVAFSSDRRVVTHRTSILGHLREEEIARATAFAIKKGARRFALIAPRGPFANIIRDRLDVLFRDSTATLDEVYLYDPNAPRGPWIADFADRTMDDVGIIDDPDHHANPAAPVRQFAYDALILATDHLVDVATMLSYHDIDTKAATIILDGRWTEQNLWNEPALEGAFFAAPNTDKKNAFTKRYRALYGHSPPAIADIVYDGVRLAIANRRRLDGTISGLESLDTNGLPVRPLRVFRIASSSFEIVEP